MKYLGTYGESRNTIKKDDGSAWYLVIAKIPNRGILLTTIKSTEIKIATVNNVFDGSRYEEYYFNAIEYFQINDKKVQKYDRVGYDILSEDLIFELTHEEILKHIITESL